MTRLIFHLLGNEDSTLIELADGRLILKDYFCSEPEGDDGKRIHLDDDLRDFLKDQGSEAAVFVPS